MFFSCTNCPLGDATKPCAVQGDFFLAGQTSAKIMIVGDFPHETDVQLGRPFTGNLGRELTKLLNESKIPFKDVYVTTLVKCRPLAGNQKEGAIKKENIDKCKIYLTEEIANISPDLVVLCGEKVFRSFFPDLKFTTERGKLLDNPDFGIKMIATYNPLASLMSTKFDPILRKDFHTIAEHLYKDVTVTKNTKDYILIKDNLRLLHSLVKRISEVPTFAFDIETHGSGLFNYKLLSIGFSWKKDTGVSIPIYVKDAEMEAKIKDVINYCVNDIIVTTKRINKKTGAETETTKKRKATVEEAIAYAKEHLPAEYCQGLGDFVRASQVKAYYLSLLDKNPPLKKHWGEHHDEVMQCIKDIMENPVPKGAHNGSYDVNRLRGIGIIVKNYAWDTILMHHLLDEERPHDLDELSELYTQDGGYKKTKDQYLESSQTSWANIPTDVLLPYNAGDADVTFQLYNTFKESLQKEGNLWKLFETHVMPAQRMLCDMEFRGSNIDKAWVQKTQQEYETRIKELKVEIATLVSKKDPTIYIVDSPEEQKEAEAQIKANPVQTVMPNFLNINSVQQLVHLFKDIYNEKLEKTTATGIALDSDVLTKIARHNKVAELLLEYKKLKKLDSTYLAGVLDKIDADNKLHTQFILYGTKTGRLASRAPNLQNIPLETKAMFIPPPGHVCVNVDQSAAELHVMAWMGNDKRMIDIFEHKRDLHRETAAGVFGKKLEEVTDEERKIAKRISFGTAYGISGVGLVDLLEPEGVKISRTQGNKYIEKWLKNYPGCARLLHGAIRLFKTKGYLETPFGRRRHKYKVFSDANKESSSERQAQNFTIQSTASDIQIYEMVQMYPTLLANNILPVLTVHDSIVLYCPYDKLEWLRDYYKQMTCRRFTNEEFPGLNNCWMWTEMEVGRNYGEHIKLPYDCDFAEWKKENSFLFEERK